MCEVVIVLQSKSIKLFLDVVTGPNLSLTTDHISLLHSLDFGGIQWSRCRNCSGLNPLLLKTLCPCRFLFYMQVMILMRSYYRLSSLAVASVDGCSFYIIIHNNISCRTWLQMLPLVPKGNITLKYAWQLTSSGLCDQSSNLFDLTLEYVHADSAEHLLLALEEASPYCNNGILFMKIYCIF